MSSSEYIYTNTLATIPVLEIKNVSFHPCNTVTRFRLCKEGDENVSLFQETSEENIKKILKMINIFNFYKRRENDNISAEVFRK